MNQQPKNPHTRSIVKLVSMLVLAIAMLSMLILGAAAAETTPEFVSARPTLGEDINLNFLATVPEEDVATAEVVFEYLGYTYPALKASEASKVVENDKTCYVFTLTSIAPQNITKPVTAKLYIDGVVVDTQEYTVKEYCDYALAQYPDAAKVAQAILNYSEAAKYYIGEIDEMPDIKDLPTKNHMSVVAEKALDADDGSEQATMDRVGLIISGSITTYFDFSTFMENPSFKVTVDGQARDAIVINNDDGTYRALVELKATEIFSKIVATVTDSQGKDISRTATYSVTAYLHKFADDPDEALATFVRTIYAYGLFSHDLKGHQVVMAGAGEGKTLVYDCILCNERFAYALSQKAYVETYDSGTGAVEPGGGSTLSNVDGTLKVVLGNGANNNADMAFNTTNYVTTKNSFLVGFDIKSAPDRETDFAVLLKPNNAWTYAPKTGNSLYVTPAGQLKVFGNVVEGVTISQDEFTSIMLNYTVSQDTSDANDVAVYTVDLWVDGTYVDQYTCEASKTTGTTAIDLSNSQVQISARYVAGKYNEIFLDNVFMADGINAAGKNMSELATTLVHNYEVTTNVPATNCYTEGKLVKTCKACAKTVTTVIPALPHENITLTVQNGQLVTTCPVCSANVQGGANWVAEHTTYTTGDVTQGNLQAFNYLTNNEYWTVKKSERQQLGANYGVAENTEKTNRKGVFSIAVKGNPGAQWRIQLSNTGSADWSGLNAKGFEFMRVDASGNVYPIIYDATAKASQGTKIATLSANEYTTLTVVFAVGAGDVITFDYYVNGTRVASTTSSNCLWKNTPVGIYADVTPASDFYIDNLYFAYSDNADAFISHTHTMQEEIVEPSNCYVEGVANRVCTTCGYTEYGAVIPKTEHQLNCVGFNKSNNAIYECSICENTFLLPVKKFENFSYVDPNYVVGELTNINNGRTWYLGDIGTGTAITDGELLMASGSSKNAQMSPNGTVLSSATEGVWGFSLKNTNVRGADFWTQLKVQNSKDAWGFNVDATKIRIKADGSIYLAGKDTGMDISKTEYTDFLVKVVLSVSGSTTTATLDVWVNSVYAGSMSTSLATTDATLQNGNSYLQLITGPSANGNQMYYDNVFIADVPAGLVANEDISSVLPSTHGQGEHKLVAVDIDANKKLVYECVVCKEHYAVPAVYGDTMSGDAFNSFGTPADVDKERSGIEDGAFVFSATKEGSGNANAYIPAYPSGKITSTGSMLLGFDIKNTEFRGTNSDAYFAIQWRVPNSSGDAWKFNADETALEIKPDGSIYFASRKTDTGLDISKDKFTSILMKATLTVDGSNTTMSVDLWVNGAYVATTSKTVAVTGCSWQNGSSGAQICVQNNKGTNEVILDNLFVADVPAGVTAGTDLADSLPLIHNLGAAEVKEPTCTKTGTSTATCRACGTVHVETIPTLPHELTYTGTIATYKCSVCLNKYVYDGVYGEEYTGEGNLGKIQFDKGGTATNGNAVTNEDGAILVTHTNAAHTSGTTVNNNALTLAPGNYIPSAQRVIVGFSLKGNGTRYGNITLQAKLSNTWNGEATRVTVDTSGNIKLSGTDTGYDLTDADFTRFVVMYTIVDKTLYFDLWVNDVYVGQGNQTFDVALSWATTNTSYAQLCLAKTGDNAKVHSMYVDNVFIADVPAEADGTDISRYLIEAPHNMEEVTVEPTCSTEGYVKNVCTDDDCDYEEILQVIPKLGHKWSNTMVYNNDVHYYECTRCQVRKGTASHVWNEGEVTLEPTCESIGTRLHTCEKCAATKQVDEPKLAHDIDFTTGAYTETAAISGSTFGYGTMTYWCTSCEKNVVFDAPVNNDYEGGQGIGTNANFTFTAMTENGNTYGQYVSKSNDGKDLLSISAAQVAASQKDGSYFKQTGRMIFSLKLKTADGYGLTDGTIFLRTAAQNGYFTLVRWNAAGVLTLPGFEDDTGDDTVIEGDDGLELPPIELIPSRPTIHMNWTELTFDVNLATDEVDVYVNGEYVATTSGNYAAALPAVNGQYISLKLSSSVAGDTAICVDDIKLVYVD